MKSHRDKSAPSATRHLHDDHLHDDHMHDDVVWNTDQLDPTDEFPVAPPDAALDANIRALRAAALPAVESEVSTPPVPPSIQFSLRHLLIAQAGLAVLFALMRVFLPSVLAGALGVTVLVMAVMVAILRPQDRAVLVVWWSALALYFSACVMAAAMR